MSFVEVLVYVLFVHWIADFVCQTRWMAENKSRHWDALCLHVVTYTSILAIGVAMLYVGEDRLGLKGHLRSPEWVTWFVLVNMVFHWLTDAITSKMTTCLWKKKRVHLFFATIGLDQWLHATVLLLSSRFLYQF